MSWSMDQKLVSLTVTLLALQTLQSPVLAESSVAPAKKQLTVSAAATTQPTAAANTSPENQQDVATETWETLTAQAEELASAGDNRGAEKLFIQSYETAKNFASDDSRKIKSAESLGEVIEKSGRYDNALKLYQEALELRQTAHGEGSVRLSKSYYNIGRVQMLAGDYSKARASLKKGLNLRQFSSSEEANQEDLGLIHILFSLGVLETTTGNFEKADAYLNRSQSIAQRLAKHKENAKIFSQLALLSLAQGDLPKAEDQAHTSLSMAEKFAKGDMLVRAQALDSVAMVGLARHNFTEALDASNESWKLKRNELGLRNPLTADSLLTSGLIQIAEKKYAAAEKTFDDAIAVYDQSLDQSHLSYSRALIGRAFANLKQKDKTASSHDLEQALSAMASTTGIDSHLTAKYRELFVSHSGFNFNVLETIEKIKSPNAVSKGQFDLFGQLLEIAVDDGQSDATFAGVKYKDLLPVLGVSFVVIVLIAMALLMPGAFSRLFPWGRNTEDDHATMRNKNRGKQNASQNSFAPPQQQNTLRGATETERKQVQVWKGRIKTMEKELPRSVKTSGAYDLDFKPSSKEGNSAPISFQQDLSSPVIPETSNEQYW